MNNKKALSEVVGYVLIIVIALSLSLVVYVWMKNLIPRGEEKCPEDTSLIIKNCEIKEATKELKLCVQNNGFFNVSGFYVKIANETGKAPVLGLLEKEGLEGKLRGKVFFSLDLKSKEKKEVVFDFFEYNIIQKIEIEPFRIQNKKEILCYDAVIRQDLNCFVAGYEC